jgi:opacity protein-like surface antigen
MKQFLLPALLLVTLLTTGFATQAQTADEVIDKYLTAIGGKAKWKQINSMKMEGQIEVQGIEIPFTMQGVNNKGSRVDAEFQGNKIIDITTLTQGWSQNPLAGKTTLQPISADELKLKLDNLDLQGAFIDYKEKGSTVEALGKDEEEGNEYFKIKMVTKNKVETTYFFDLKTNLIYKQESTVTQQGQDVKQTIKNLDYQDTDFGVKMPFKIDQGAFMMVVKKVITNPVVDEKLFTAE